MVSSDYLSPFTANPIPHHLQTIQCHLCILPQKGKPITKSCPTLLQPTRLVCPWDFLSKNAGVDCHFLLQGIFPTRGSTLHRLHQQANSLPLSHKGNHPLPYFSQTWIQHFLHFSRLCGKQSYHHQIGSNSIPHQIALLQDASLCSLPGLLIAFILTIHSTITPFSIISTSETSTRHHKNGVTAAKPFIHGLSLESLSFQVPQLITCFSSLPHSSYLRISFQSPSCLLTFATHSRIIFSSDIPTG